MGVKFMVKKRYVTLEWPQTSYLSKKQRRVEDRSLWDAKMNEWASGK